MANEFSHGDLVVVKTVRGEGRFQYTVDGLHAYLQEVEPGTVRKLTGHGGCVMAARPGPGVEVNKLNGKKGGV